MNWEDIETGELYEITITDKNELKDCKQKPIGRNKGRSIPLFETNPTNEMKVMTVFNSSMNMQEENTTAVSSSGWP